MGLKIGLEVHVQLTTKTKLFCGCRNSFSSEPNTLTCETCLGMPGSKPLLNREAVDYGLKIALALRCLLPSKMMFSRKSYFYPDMSKNFQITQYEMPLAGIGFVESNEKKIGITRIQLEEDPARIINEKNYVLVDYNRSGTPLCEIVTEPDFSSPKEAREFLQELSGVLQYLDVYDPNIEGSMRVDSNISLEGGNRVEIKNISGFRDVEKALNYEIIRQRNAMRRGSEIKRETRGWDSVSGVTRPQRVKEEEEDYGYITETDLPKVSIEKSKIEELKKQMPEMPKQKIERYIEEGMKKDLAVSITSDPGMAEIFELVSEAVDKNLAASWFAGELKKTLNYNNLRMKDTRINDNHMIRLLKMVEAGEITVKTAEQIIRKMVINNKPENFLKQDNMAKISDEDELINIIKEVLNENAQAVLDYKAGKFESFNFLVGQVMRKTRGRGDPNIIRKLLKNKI